MDGARGQNWRIGDTYSGTPTNENPVLLAVIDYTQRDIDKAANGTDFKSAAFKIDSSHISGDKIRNVALLRYETLYHPSLYLILSPWEFMQ